MFDNYEMQQIEAARAELRKIKTPKDFYRIENQDYPTKADFIHDLRHNGYRVNPKKVKPAEVFDYIMNHTNCNPWDWDIKAIPAE